VKRLFSGDLARRRFRGATQLTWHAVWTDTAAYVMPVVARALVLLLVVAGCARVADGKWFPRHPALAVPALVVCIALAVAVAGAVLAGYAWFLATGRYAALCGTASARVPAAIRRATAWLQLPINLPSATALLDVVFPLLPLHALRVECASLVGAAMHRVSALVVALSLLAVPLTLGLGRSLLRAAWAPGGAPGAVYFGGDAVEGLFGVVALPLLAYATVLAATSHLAGASPLTTPASGVVRPRVLRGELVCRLLLAVAAVAPLAYHGVVRYHCLSADGVAVRTNARGVTTNTRHVLCASAWEALAAVAADTNNTSMPVTLDVPPPLPDAPPSTSQPQPPEGEDWQFLGDLGVLPSGDGVSSGSSGDSSGSSASSKPTSSPPAAGKKQPVAAPEPTPTVESENAIVTVVKAIFGVLLIVVLVAVVLISLASGGNNTIDAESARALFTGLWNLACFVARSIWLAVRVVVVAAWTALDPTVFWRDCLSTPLGGSVAVLVVAASVAAGFCRRPGAPSPVVTPRAAVMRAGGGAAFVYAGWAVARYLLIVLVTLFDEVAVLSRVVVASATAAIFPLLCLLWFRRALDYIAPGYRNAPDESRPPAGPRAVAIAADLLPQHPAPADADADAAVPVPAPVRGDFTTAILSPAAVHRATVVMRLIVCGTLLALALDYDFQDRVPLLARIPYQALAMPLIVLLAALAAYTFLAALASLHASVRALPPLNPHTAQAGNDADPFDRPLVLSSALVPLDADDYPVWHAAQPMHMAFAAINLS